MKKWSSRLLALVLCGALVLGEGSIVSAAEAVESPTETATEEVVETTEEMISEEASEEVSEEISEEVSEETSEEVSEEVIEELHTYADMFPGLADISLIEADNKSQRTELLNNVMDLGNQVAGADYVENEILVTVYSEELALEYAEAFGGSLKLFDENFAVITLNANPELAKATVMDAVMASADPVNNLPVVWPNGFYYFDEFEEEEPVEEFSEEEFLQDIADAASGEMDDEAGLLAYNDPYLASTNSRYQWFHTTIGSQYAWEAGYTGAGIKVGVLDTGVNNTHEDLTANLKAANYVVGTSGKDKQGHGTHVSGIIGAKGNNNKGGSGVAPGVSLYSYKVSDTAGIDMANVIKAMNQARTDGMDILNLSLGGPQYNGTVANAVKSMYNSGIAVFCAAGNDDTNSLHYPASYTGAISIAAIDKGTQKASFSAYGSKVRYSAPGVDIYSTAYNGNSNYVVMSGTSMATPAAVGTAAVVLQYARAKKLYTEKGTSADVKNLLKVMDKGIIKAKGSGLGKGYVNLPKALGLSDALKAPAAPTVTVKAGTYTSASVKVKFNTVPGSTIYYSMDGKTPSYKNGEILSGIAYTNNSEITVSGAKTVTLKAIAVNNTTKLVSKASTAKYTFKPLISSFTLRGDGGATSIAKGTKLKVVPVISPNYAANQKMTWSVQGAPAGITVNSSGVVTVKATAAVTSCTIVAVAKDGSGKSSQIKLGIVENTNPITAIKVSKKSVAVAKGGYIDLDASVTKKDKTTAGITNIKWASNDTSVATVSVVNGKVRITGAKLGKTKIVGAAADGSGKTVTISVSVGIAVTSVTADTVSTLAQGSSVTIGTKVKPSNATNKKIEWTVSPADKGVTVKSGKLTASKTATLGSYTLTYKTTDGTNKTGTMKFSVVASKITSLTINKKSAEIFRTKGNHNVATSTTIGVTAVGGTSWVATSSNDDIATVSKSGSNVVVTATGRATGTTTITVKATDGSNKKATCKVTVSNPASGLTLSVPNGRSVAVAKGKSMKLVSNLEQEFGKISASSKKLVWTSSNTSAFTVSSSGTVKALRNDGSSSIIKATTPDGKVSAEFTVYAVTPISAIAILEWYTYADYYYTYLSSGTISAPILMKFQGASSGAFSLDQFNYTVSGDGVSLTLDKYDDGTPRLNVTPNKKGMYNITVKTKEGCSKSHMITLEVR